MNRRRFIALAALVPVAGCGAPSETDPSRLDLTVQNERDDPIAVEVTVVDEEGTSYAEETDEIGSGVARAFEVAVGTSGRHEVVVTGADWQGQLAWNADTCAVFDGTVRLTEESVEVAGECVSPR